MTTRAELNAIRDLLETNDSIKGRVFVSQAYDDQGKPLLDVPYWVIHPAGGSDHQTRLTGDYAEHTASFVIHSVNEDADGVLWAGERVDETLRPDGRGVAPVVGGRRTEPLRRDALLPVQVDTDPSPSLLYQPAEYSYTSSPA